MPCRVASDVGQFRTNNLSLVIAGEDWGGLSLCNVSCWFSAQSLVDGSLHEETLDRNLALTVPMIPTGGPESIGHGVEIGFSLCRAGNMGEDYARDTEPSNRYLQVNPHKPLNWEGGDGLQPATMRFHILLPLV